MHVLGVDLSSRALDLVLLDENANRATWTRIDLEGASAFERTRDVVEKMPQPGWYDAHGVYLIALERPFVRFGQDVIRLVQGAVLACLPAELTVWEVTPSQWKPPLGVATKGKPTMDAFPAFTFRTQGDPRDLLHGWPQDALDALGVALYARDTNARAVARMLETIRQKTDRCPACGEDVINVGAHAERCTGA